MSGGFAGEASHVSEIKGEPSSHGKNRGDSHSNGHVYVFEDFELHTETCELLHAGRPAGLQLKPTRLLLYLIEHRERTVPKEELLEAIWPGGYVGETAFTTAVGEIRRALSDQGNSRRLIRTFRGRGYRFVGAVECFGGESTPGDGAEVPSVAVLPFINMGDTHDYFSEGVAEEILNRMVELRGVRVISRTSSFGFKGTSMDIREVGARLTADYILQGSVRRAADVVRISVQLTDASDGTELWSRSYDREPVNILALQDEIALETVRELVPSLSSTLTNPIEVDPVAYDLYLRGRQALSDSRPADAVPLLESATIIDSKFAAAYGALVTAYNYADGASEKVVFDRDKPRAWLKRALELDPKNVEALASRAWHGNICEGGDLQTAISELEHLIRQHPNSPPTYFSPTYFYAVALFTAGKHRETLAIHQRLQSLEPTSLLYSFGRPLIGTLFQLGEFDRARTLLQAQIRARIGGWRPGTKNRTTVLHFLMALSQERFADVEGMIRESKYDHQWIEKFGPIFLALMRGDTSRAQVLFRNIGPDEIYSSGSNPIMEDRRLLDVALTKSTSRYVEEFAAKVDQHKSFRTFWLASRQSFDQWWYQFGPPAIKEAIQMLRGDPGYQEQLRRIGIDDKTLSELVVHTDELWD